MVYHKVRNLDEIIKIIVPHFEKYPLITQKQADFILFKNIVELMSKGEHLNNNGLTKIISLKAYLNKGLSDKLKIYYPNAIKVKRPEVDLLLSIDYNWVAGFFSGEVCFYINIYKSKNHKLAYTLMLQIIIGQHIRDKLLISSLIDILGCDKISERINRDMVILSISKFQDNIVKFYLF